MREIKVRQLLREFAMNMAFTAMLLMIAFLIAQMTHEEGFPLFIMFWVFVAGYSLKAVVQFYQKRRRTLHSEGADAVE